MYKLYNTCPLQKNLIKYIKQDIQCMVIIHIEYVKFQIIFDKETMKHKKAQMVFEIHTNYLFFIFITL